MLVSKQKTGGKFCVRKLSRDKRRGKQVENPCSRAKLVFSTNSSRLLCTWVVYPYQIQTTVFHLQYTQLPIGIHSSPQRVAYTHASLGILCWLNAGVEDFAPRRLGEEMCYGNGCRAWMPRENHRCRNYHREWDQSRVVGSLEFFSWTFCRFVIIEILLHVYFNF